MKKIFYLLITIFTLYSCTDQSTFNNPVTYELENGAFARFTDATMPVTFSDPQAVSFSDQVFDANNNMTSYTLALQAIIGGTTYIDENFISITSFPASVDITSQSIADAIGLDVNTFSFGDSFLFTATAVRNDGTVFYGAPPTFDDDNLTVGLGNTDNQLNSSAAYISAMQFGTIIACAEFIAAEMPGTWTVTNDAWNDYAGGASVTVEAGPTANTFHILNTTNPAPDNAASVIMVITVDNAGNVTDITSNELYNYGGTMIDPNDGGGGLVFSCVGVININVQWLTPDNTGTYGTYNFALSKQ
jgi:hypothetical protein